MVEMTFLSEMFATEKNSPFQLLTLRLKAQIEFEVFFFLHLSRGKGGDGGDGKEDITEAVRNSGLQSVIT